MRCSKKLLTERLPTSTILRTIDTGGYSHTNDPRRLPLPYPFLPWTGYAHSSRPIRGRDIHLRPLHDPKELLAFSSHLLPGPKEREQPQNRDVDPDQRDHQPERRVPLHEPRAPAAADLSMKSKSSVRLS